MKNMKLCKNACTGETLFIIFCMVLLFSPFLLLAQQEQEAPEVTGNEQETIVERVTVTNVEVPVRVYRKGLPVTDLTRADFTLYEDKTEMDINGFFLKRKTLRVPGSGEAVQKPGPALPRTFVLVFSVTDFNEHLVKAVEHLFGSIFRPTDRLLVFANNKTLEYPNLKDMDTIKQRLLVDLREESQEARQKLSVYIHEIENYINISEFKIESYGWEKVSVKIHNFLKKYSAAWNDYKRKYLTPNIDRFYMFSRYLEKVKGEKWVLNFYQFDLFPNIRMNSQVANYIRDAIIGFSESRDYGDQAIGKMCSTLLDEILVEMNAGRGFPVEDIAKLFYKVDATFHSFFIKTMSKGGPNDLEYQEVASDIENTLKQITDVTGGTSITSNDLVQSLDTVAEVEDTYYLLTYAPPNPKKVGKIKVKVKGKGYEVLYDDNLRADYIAEYLKKKEDQLKTPDIKIADFSFKEKILAFTVKDYLMKPAAENNSLGQMKIRIRLSKKNENAMMFDQEKILTAQKEEMKISLGVFKTLQKGEYNLLIDAADMLTGKEDNFHQDIVVSR